MSEVVVAKFGGSSVANAAQIRKVADIVTQDPRRRFVVVSAPGRSDPMEEKVTDHLINIATRGTHFQDRRKPIPVESSRQAVLEKFSSIAKDLELDGDEILAGLEEDLHCSLKGDRRIAFVASRGEHYNAKLIAAYLTKTGMTARARLPEDLGLMVSAEYLDAKVQPEAYPSMASQLKGDEIAVIPGFYGVTGAGDVAVFSRGGSDLTGGELAYAVQAETYENWTDVSGVLEADPRIISEAQVIPRLTYKEIRLLSSKGFNVFHFDAMRSCRQRKIPISIRNTNRPQDRGTMVLNERVPEEGVVGIARLDNIAYIYLEKDTLGEEIGFTAGLLEIFKEHNINTYHYPTDKDDIAIVVDQDDLKGAINDMRREIEERLQPDYMDVVYNLAIITAVGIGLKGNSYPIIDALSALGENHIPIEMVDQSPSQICFHIGISQMVADEATRILYDALITKNTS